MAQRLPLVLPLVALVILAAGLPASAAPSAAGVLPGPEVLPAQTYQFQLQTHGIQVLQAAEAHYSLGLQVGLADRLEVGVDMRLGEPNDNFPNRVYRTELLGYNPITEGWEDMWFNVKLQALTETRRRPAVAVGLLSLGARGESGRYVTAGKHFGPWQLALGWADAYGSPDDFWYEILCYQVRDRGRAVLEHCSGGRFSTNLAYEYPVTDRWTATGGYMFANNGLYDSDILLRVSYTDKW